MYTLLAIVTSDICALQRRGLLVMNVGAQETTSNYATRIDFDCDFGRDNSHLEAMGREPQSSGGGRTINSTTRDAGSAAVPRFYLIRILIWQP